MVLVKVARLGGEVQEFALEDGSTVQDALDRADIEVNGDSIEVNNVRVTETQEIEDGDVIAVIPNIKGGR